MLVLVNDMYCYIHVMIDLFSTYGKMMSEVGFSAEICKISVCCSPFSSLRILVSVGLVFFSQETGLLPI